MEQILSAEFNDLFPHIDRAEALLTNIGIPLSGHQINSISILQNRCSFGLYRKLLIGFDNSANLNSPLSLTLQMRVPRKAEDNGWFGLGPVIFTLVCVHIAALIFWIVLLIRGNRTTVRKADIKQH